MPNDDDIKAMMSAQQAAPQAPFVHIEVHGNQLKIASNVPNVFIQLGILAAALHGISAQGAGAAPSQPSGRIITLS